VVTATEDTSEPAATNDTPGGSPKGGNRVAASARIWHGVDLRNSDLGEHVSIGDHSIILKCSFEGNNQINRRNFIQDSRIGRYSYTGYNTTIRAADVGRFCSISWNVSIGGKDHPLDRVTTSPLWGFLKMDDQGATPRGFNYGEGSGPCTIGHDVWIGTNTVVLRNVAIGHGAVVGAGSVVTRDVEPFTVVAGAPARQIRRRFEPTITAALLALAWWDWPPDIIRSHIPLFFASPMNGRVIRELQRLQPNCEPRQRNGDPGS
jgi:virginiamycin A acetyltransferase